MPIPTRRQFLTETGTGLGAIAFAWLLHADGRSADASPHANKPHFLARAKRAINIYSPGGVSHVDTFDYKPDLARYHGQPLTGKGTLDPFFGKPGNLMRSPYAFRRSGQSGHWVSELLPNL